MLRMDLVDLINSGTAWAFVGSGVSSDAGCPSWQALVDHVVGKLGPEVAGSVRTDSIYAAEYMRKNFPKCFSRIERICANRQELEDVISERIQAVQLPGKLGQILADWPFAGYITTNYDLLVEKALQGLGQLGWSPVGNSEFEVKKLSGSPDRVVWHIHGAVGLPKDKSSLVLTEDDYDKFYLDSSPMMSQLGTLLTHRRAVFIGFGFHDQEVMRVLKRVGKLCSPARPAFAFLHGISGMEYRAERQELLERYNIDVIPYTVEGASHRQLIDLLGIYASFVLRRTQRFGSPARPCPSYDPETTGLLIYNNLALSGNTRLDGSVIGPIIKARILSLLQYRGRQTIETIQNDIRDRAEVISGQQSASVDATQQIVGCIDELAQQGYIQIEAQPGAQDVTLTAQGAELAANQAAMAERLAEQFVASLVGRVSQSNIVDRVSIDRVTRAIEAFLKDCIQRRSLGMAMIWGSSLDDYRSFHMVALMQALPEFLQELANIDEAKLVIRVVTDVLARPAEAEKTYLGLLLQAQFGLHLLGYDPSTLVARSRALASTLFLIDSTTLIPFLARSSSGYETARLLVNKLLSVGASVATTSMLADESVEHARWPIDAKVVQATGQCTIETVKASLGRAGYRSNAFLEGFLEEAGAGRIPLNFLVYMQSVCSCRLYDANGLRSAIHETLRNTRALPIAFDEWSGFVDELWTERDNIAQQVMAQRQASQTFKHERQVRAEAEALIVIQKVRNGSLRLDAHDLRDAYFVSRTRVLDTISGEEGRVTMRPEAVLHWLATVSPCPVEELAQLVNGLLWELSERGFAVVDTKRLQVVFSPLINAAKEQLQEELGHHRILISHQYGTSAASAFAEASDINLPVVMESYFAQMGDELSRRVSELEAQQGKLEHQAAYIESLRASEHKLARQDKLPSSELIELERLRAKNKAKRDKDTRRNRRAKSQPSSRRRK